MIANLQATLHDFKPQLVVLDLWKISDREANAIKRAIEADAPDRKVILVIHRNKEDGV